MNITHKLRQLLAEKCGLAADATDEVARKCLAENIASGKLDIDAVKATQVEEVKEGEKLIRSIVGEEFTKNFVPAMNELKALFTGGKPIGSDGASAGGSPSSAGAAGQTAPSDPQKALAAAGIAGQAGVGSQGNSGGTGEAYPDQIRVKSVIEQFRDSRTAATWDKSSDPSGYLQKAFGGRQIMSGEGPGSYSLDMPTDRQKAIVGAWFKRMCLNSMKASGIPIPAHLQLKEIDRQILQYTVHECKFVGPIGYRGGDADTSDAESWCEGEKIASDFHRKALLDDSTSGGLEAVPIEFDAAVILTPLLNGQIFPFVNVVNVTRRRIEATKIGNPTMAWGTSEGTSIGLFNTDSFISAFDNSIYPISGAMELGLDFLSDSPLSVGAIVVDNYGKRFLKEMDDVIVAGNGTNRPEGVFTASGTTTITAVSAGAAPSLGDYESLWAGVAKEYREEPGARPIYIGTDTSYKRARGIPVNSSSDARRIFGLDQQSYQVLGYPFRVASTDAIANTKLGFLMANRYRLYRRQGLEVRVVREDWSLARQNQMGIVVRARFGGALEQGGAFAKQTDAQA